jgi:hypothetical protein
MEFVDLFDPPSWAKVIVGTVVYFGLGAVWYNPHVFGKAWMKESGVDFNDESAKARMPLTFGLTFVMSFVAMLVLVRLVPPGLEIAKALQAALILGIAFILPVSGMNALYEGKSARFFAINYGYHQVAIVLAAVIFAVWK